MKLGMGERLPGEKLLGRTSSRHWRAGMGVVRPGMSGYRAGEPHRMLKGEDTRGEEDPGGHTSASYRVWAKKPKHLSFDVIKQTPRNEGWEGI